MGEEFVLFLLVESPQLLRLLSFANRPELCGLLNGLRLLVVAGTELGSFELLFCLSLLLEGLGVLLGGVRQTLDGFVLIFLICLPGIVRQRLKFILVLLGFGGEFSGALGESILFKLESFTIHLRQFLRIR